jgi:hypothetical protein
VEIPKRIHTNRNTIIPVRITAEICGNILFNANVCMFYSPEMQNGMKMQWDGKWNGSVNTPTGFHATDTPASHTDVRSDKLDDNHCELMCFQCLIVNVVHLMCVESFIHSFIISFISAFHPDFLVRSLDRFSPSHSDQYECPN